MREHPVPQDVTGYQFHIIGNMTIKQFAELCLGVIIGLMFYGSNLPMIIKWPLIGMAIGAGVLAAFVPFEERMLDHWIVTFIRVLYRPTKFYWRKEPKIPDPFLYESNGQRNMEPEIDLSPARRQRIKDYLHSLNDEDSRDAFDKYQDDRIAELMTAFSQVTVAQTSVQEHAVKPSLEVRQRSLNITAPTSNDALAVENKSILSTDQVAQEIAIPEVANVAVDSSVTDPTTASAATLDTPESTIQVVTQYVPTQSTPSFDPDQLTMAQFNQNLPFPTAPTEPNRPVGMVLGPNYELASGAIVEIATSDGQVARAIKTNSLGQFFVTTALAPGNYVLTVDHPNYEFTSFQLQLTNQVVPPLEIKATGVTAVANTAAPVQPDIVTMAPPQAAPALAFAQ
jgi:hypothetical protein